MFAYYIYAKAQPKAAHISLSLLCLSTFSREMAAAKFNQCPSNVEINVNTVQPRASNHRDGLSVRREPGIFKLFSALSGRGRKAIPQKLGSCV